MGRRYLVEFDSDKLFKEETDVIIIGSGVAGLYTALLIPDNFHVTIITKDTIDICNSSLAQGGIAVPIDSEDSPAFHFQDTINAGANLCNEEAVWVLVNEAVENIEILCSLGVRFDTKNAKEFILTKEAAHCKNRIVHIEDTTGCKICEVLIENVRKRSNIVIKEKQFVVDVITSNNSCQGVLVYNSATDTYSIVKSSIIVLATGGIGQIYTNTTNAKIATGDGIGIASRAGAKLVDMEFIQFHPTVFAHPDNKEFLISEAVRGEGAVLRNSFKEKFMYKFHGLKDLAPRDIVARAIFEETKRTDLDHVYLDITFKDRDYLIGRFPNIYSTCKRYGIDITTDYIPVAPAAHYCMGGIYTDIDGKTNINGLYACGEVACTGVHGANRLASNSLLEGLVFGRRIAKDITHIRGSGGESPIRESLEEPRETLKASQISLLLKVQQGLNKKNMHLTENNSINRNLIKKDIQKIMTENVGIVRSKEGLTSAYSKFKEYSKILGGYRNTCIEDFELQNMIITVKIIVGAALMREESRGAHFRLDFPVSG